MPRHCRDHRSGRSRTSRTVGDVSFSDRKWTGVFEPLRDPARFARVQIDPLFATIVWPEDGLDMAPEPLYAEACRYADGGSGQGDHTADGESSVGS